MFDKLKSRKLWAAVLAAVLVAFGTGLGLDEGQALAIAGVISAYVLGQGVADVGHRVPPRAVGALSDADLRAEVERRAGGGGA